MTVLRVLRMVIMTPSFDLALTCERQAKLLLKSKTSVRNYTHSSITLMALSFPGYVQLSKVTT